MQIYKKAIFLILGLALSLPGSSFGQVLEALPDEGLPVFSTHVEKEKEQAQEVEDGERTHLGGTFSGSAGLITIATPDFQERSAGFSYKKAYSKSNINMNNSKVNLEKDEFFASLRANIKPNLEVSVNRLKYIRASSPNVKGLNFEREHYGLGLKYSAKMSEHKFCMGFNFTPMTAEELNLADIEQIENLRNMYITMSEKISDNLDGYLNVTSAFTKNQKIDFGNGIVQTLNRKDIVISSVGLEYHLAKTATVFGEAKFGNYRDIFKNDSVRHRIHAGIRFGVQNFQLELVGLNLSEDNPTTVIGGSVGF